MPKKITKTLITKLLHESKFDPRERGPLKIVVDSHSDDPQYLESKAIEMIMEARLDKTRGPEYHERIAKAISILGLARAVATINVG